MSSLQPVRGTHDLLPEAMRRHRAVIDTASWAWPPVFSWLQDQGRIAREEMLRTFNCGIGMVICLPQAEAAKAIDLLQSLGEQVFELGHIGPSDTVQPYVSYDA